MIINEKEYEILKKAQEITWSDYLGDAKTFVKDNERSYYVEPSVFICAVEDLLGELDHQKEKYEDLEQDLQDNYEPISPYKMYGISEDVFH